MKSQKLEGLIAAPFTPMYSDGKINISLIPSYYEMLLENGVKGAFICGSTGEGVSLTMAEKMEVAAAWSSVTKGNEAFKVMMFLGGNCIEECKELAKHAQSLGLYAVSFTSPFYFKPASTEILAQMCKEIAAEVPDMPFYYYHIPVLTGVYFNMIDLLNAIDGSIPNFAGIKYTHEDFMDFQSCIHFKNGNYDMLWGRDENMLAALAIGAKGAVGSTYNYAPALYYDMMDAFNNNELDQARILQQKSIDMIGLLGKYGGIATGKAYMKLMGLDCGHFRLPVKNMSTAQMEAFVQEADSIGFHTFCANMPKYS